MTEPIKTESPQKPEPEQPPKLPLSIRIARFSVLFGLNKLLVLGAIASAIIAVFGLLDGQARSIAATCLLVGLWTAGCIMLGQYLAYKRHVEASPLPQIDDEQATTMIVQELTKRQRQKTHANARPRRSSIL